VSLRMTGHTVAAPLGLPRTPPATGPVFNVFVLIPVTPDFKPGPVTGLKVVSQGQ